MGRIQGMAEASATVTEQPPAGSRLLNRAEFAASAGVSPGTVSRWLAAGKVSCHGERGSQRRYQAPDGPAGGGKLLTPAEAAAVTGVSVKVLAARSAAWSLTVCRTEGGHRRYREDEIRALAVKLASLRGDDLVNRAEAALMLRVSGATIGRYEAQGLITEAARNRKARLYRRADVLALLTAGAEQGAAA